MKEINIELKLKNLLKEGLQDQALSGSPMLYSKVFDEYGSCEGDLIIYFNGKPSNTLDDEMPALVKNICYGAIPDLLQGKNVVYSYFNQYGYLRMDPEGNKLLVSGDGLNQVRYPLKAFVDEMFAQGEQFLEILQNLSTANETEASDLKRLLDLLSVERTKALAALS